jgi:hypothetical protein
MPKGVNFPLYVPSACSDVIALVEASRPEAAIEWLSRKMDTGSHAASALLAYIHLRGGAPKEGFLAAFKKCTTAAEAGDPFAEFVLAQILQSAGKETEAKEWLVKSCNQQFAPALSHMGRNMSMGIGFPAPDRRSAMVMYRLALQRRHVPALIFLAKHLFASRNPVVWLAGVLLAPVAFVIGVISFQVAPFKLNNFVHISGSPLFAVRK